MLKVTKRQTQRVKKCNKWIQTQWLSNRASLRWALFAFIVFVIGICAMFIYFGDSNDHLEELAEKLDWWDSSSSSVIALAYGYGLNTFKAFVGSLRMTGYQGHIILGIDGNAPLPIQNYLKSMNVTTKKLNFSADYCENGQPGNCAEEYPRYKLDWARFPLSRDWLLECESCTGGVMLTDARDAYFQSDPFLYPFGDEPMKKLPGQMMIFEEIPSQTVDSFAPFNDQVKRCKGVDLKGYPMLCSGSLMGTRHGVVDFVDQWVKEFDRWSERKECNGASDQSILNYIFYSKQLKNAVTIPHRTGPIQVIGVQANNIFRATIQKAKAEGYGGDAELGAEKFVNGNGYVNWKKEGQNDSIENAWLPSEYKMIDPETGLILNLDGKPSPQVHQYDRFGHRAGEILIDKVRQFYENEKHIPLTMKSSNYAMSGWMVAIIVILAIGAVVLLARNSSSSMIGQIVQENYLPWIVKKCQQKYPFLTAFNRRNQTSAYIK